MSFDLIAYLQNLPAKVFIYLTLIFIADGLMQLLGRFETIQRYSSDWIFARRIFKRNGFSLMVHRIAGAYIVLSGLYVLYALYAGITTQFLSTHQILIPIFVAILFLAYLIKVFVGDENTWQDFKHLLKRYGLVTAIVVVTFYIYFPSGPDDVITTIPILAYLGLNHYLKIGVVLGIAGLLTVFLFGHFKGETK